MRVATDSARAQGMIKTIKTNKQPTDTGFRPYTSLKGAINIEPTARPIRYRVRPKVTIVLEVPNSAAMSATPEVYEVEYKTLVTVRHV